MGYETQFFIVLDTLIGYKDSAMLPVSVILFIVFTCLFKV